MGVLKTTWNSVITNIKSLKITVEPLMFVLAAASTVTYGSSFFNVFFSGVLTPHLDKLKMERVYPQHNLTKAEADKFYSKKMVEWDNNYDYINLPISCIAGIIYGLLDGGGSLYELRL